MNPPDKPHLVYDTLAESYESWIHESAGLQVIYKAFDQALELHRDKLRGRVLDLGCGTGIYTRKLSMCRGIDHVIGLDISTESVVQAGRSCNASCGFTAASATDIPFRDSSFDAAVAFGDTISHIHSRYKDAVLELARVVKPGGHIFFDIDNKWNLGLFSEPHELKAALCNPFAGHIREWSFLDSSGEYCSLHFKTFVPSEIRGILSDAGFSVLEMQGLIILPNIIPQRFHYNYPPEKFLGKMISALGRVDNAIKKLPIFRGFGIGMLVVAKKYG